MPYICYFNGYEIKDSNSRLKAKALLDFIDKDLEMMLIEDLRSSDFIDPAKYDGAEVINKYLNTEKGMIHVPEGIKTTFNSVVIDSEKEINNVFVHIEKSGPGTVLIKFSSDGGENFKQINDGALNTVTSGTRNIVLQFQIIGEIYIKDLYFGIKS